MHTSVSVVVSLYYLKGGQQEEALIFSETSGSDLATRKRRRPPPRRIRSTALQQEVRRERQEFSYMKLSRDRKDEGASLSWLAPINQLAKEADSYGYG